MSTPASNRRILSIDLLRGLAVLAMIETHVIGLVLRPDLRATVAFDIIDLINGLVAPAFLLTAGFAAVLASRTLLTETGTDRFVLLRLARRILVVWMLGYAMRLPGFSVASILGAGEADWLNFMAVDVLQCIALGWVLIYGIRLTFRSDRAFLRATLAATAVLLLAAPAVWSLDAQAALPAPIAAYFDSQAGSLFPLFPWLTFMTAGAAFATLYLNAKRDGLADRLISRAGWAGLLVAGASYGILALYIDRMPMAWDVNPLGLAMRFGLVFAILGMAGFWDRRLRNARGPVSNVVLQIGKQSLPVYVVHLLFLYRAPWGSESFPVHWGAKLGIAGSAGWILILALAMVALAFAWPRIQHHLREMTRATQPAYRALAGAGAVSVLLLTWLLPFLS